MPIREDQLTDQNLVKRMVLKRCVYGVDKNPMAVELAKLSLWLHTFTVGAPLSFLDHHLRCGNSLVRRAGAQGDRRIAATRGTLLINDAMRRAEARSKAWNSSRTDRRRDRRSQGRAPRQFARGRAGSRRCGEFSTFWQA